MGDISERYKIELAARKRCRELTFGQEVTNICTTDKNPHHHAFFVEYVVDSYTNRAGITHSSHYAKCTDRRGKFWKTAVEVIYPGRLPQDECARLFDPVWVANHGPRPAQKTEGKEGSAQ